MSWDPLEEEPPDLQEVLDALDDPDCRTIIKTIEGRMTASEVSEKCDIPLSTTYRKLDILSSASLLEETMQVRSDGKHTTLYLLAFEEVKIALTDTREFEVSIGRPPETPERRLASMWSEVRKQT